MSLPVPRRLTYRIQVLVASGTRFERVYVETTVRCLPEHIEGFADQVHRVLADNGHRDHRVNYRQE